MDITTYHNQFCWHRNPAHFLLETLVVIDALSDCNEHHHCHYCRRHRHDVGFSQVGEKVHILLNVGK